MKKFGNLTAAMLIFVFISVLTAGCGGRISVPETLPEPETHTAPQDNGTAPGFTEEADIPEETEIKETESAAETENETKEVPTEQITSEEIPSENPPESLPPAPAETEKAPSPPTPDVPAAPNPGGFIGTNQESYNPYGCDKDRAEELAERIESGNLSTQGLFKNTLFVGDSIIVGFSDYKLANQGNVIASVGAMLNPHLADNMQKIIDYNPEVLVIHYGLNEMGGNDSFVRSFIKELRAELEVLKAELPYTKIVVMSMWPIKESAAAEQPRLANLPNYNKEIRNLCVELGVAYDERSELFTSNPDWYQNDGIHCVKQMYLEWINDFIKEMGLY